MKRSVLIPLFLLVTFAVAAQGGMAKPFAGGISLSISSSAIGSSVSSSSRGAVASTGSSVAVSTSRGSSNSLGLTTSLSGRSIFSTPTSGSMSGGGSGFSGSKGSSGSSSYGGGSLGGSVGQPFKSDGGDSAVPDEYTRFDNKGFNDMTTSYENGPMSDALIPLLVLLSLFVAYKKFKMNK